MSVFGSREDDPLLQDDPFAPSSDDDTASEEETAEPAPPQDHSSGDGSPSEHPPQTDRNVASSSAASDTLAGSVFEPSTEPETPSQEERSDDDGAPRVIVRSLAQATEGQLAPLNAAINDGWRLQRVELRPAGSPEQPRSADTTRSLAFVLRRAQS